MLRKLHLAEAVSDLDCRGLWMTAQFWSAQIGAVERCQFWHTVVWAGPGFVELSLWAACLLSLVLMMSSNCSFFFFTLVTFCTWGYQWFPGIIPRTLWCELLPWVQYVVIFSRFVKQHSIFPSAHDRVLNLRPQCSVPTNEVSLLPYSTGADPVLGGLCSLAFRPREVPGQLSFLKEHCLFSVLYAWVQKTRSSWKGQDCVLVHNIVSELGGRTSLQETIVGSYRTALFTWLVEVAASPVGF